MTIEKAVPQPGHMLLRDRMAYALKAAYLRAVAENQQDFAPPSPACEELEKVVDGIVGHVAKRTPPMSLDRFLPDAVKRAEGAVQSLMGAAYGEIEPIVTRFGSQADRIKCSECSGGDICDGGVKDDRIVAVGGRCIADIRTAFDSALAHARREYAYLSEVRVVLGTDGYTTYRGQVPGIRLAFNGRTRFEDGVGKTSVVMLEVASTLLDAESLAALPYVLLHEVFCHAYQMSASPTPRENETVFVDPVSEGMFDFLAVGILRFEADRSKDTRPDALAEAEIADRIHLARKSFTAKPMFPQAPQVALGAAVWEQIHRLYLEDDPDPVAADRDAKKLAFDFNLHAWGYEQRFSGFTRLMKLLNRPRDPKLIDLLLRYRNTPEIETMVAFLLK